MQRAHSNYFKTHDRYLYQGQEMDDEVKGDGNSVNYKYRMHDPRLGRFFAVDPLYRSYAFNSTYAFSQNRVLDGVEMEGLEFQNIVSFFQTWDMLRCKFPDVEEEDIMNQFYKVTIKDYNNTSYDFMVKTFKGDPDVFLDCETAEFTPVDYEYGKWNLQFGSILSIDADWTVDMGVYCIGVTETENSISAKFVTLEGHVEKGLITFSILNNLDGTISFTIESQSYPDVTLVTDAYAREMQIAFWCEVMGEFITENAATEVERRVEFSTTHYDPISKTASTSDTQKYNVVNGSTNYSAQGEQLYEKYIESENCED